MTKIKTARTTEGEKFYYLGHTQAVVNDAGDSIEDLLAEQDEKIELLNDNTGVSDYPEFETSKTYKTGTIVKYEGALYKFTADHAVGIWDSGEVKAWNTNAETQEKLSELGSVIGGNLSPEQIILDIANNDAYIYNDGYIVSGGNASYSKPFKLGSGKTVSIYCMGYLSNVSIISEVISEDNKYNPLVVSVDSDMRVYKYTNNSHEDMNISVSFRNKGGAIVHISEVIDASARKLAELNQLSSSKNAVEIVNMNQYSLGILKIEGYASSDKLETWGTDKLNFNIGYYPGNQKVYLQGRITGVSELLVDISLSVDDVPSGVNEYMFISNDKEVVVHAVIDCDIITNLSNTGLEIRFQDIRDLNSSPIGAILSNQSQSNKIGMLENIFGISELEVEVSNNDAYIDNRGNVVSGGNASYSKPILLNLGETIVVSCMGYLSNVSIISKVETDGSIYKPLVISVDSEQRTYRYTNLSEKEMSVAVSYRNKGGIQALKVKENCLDSKTFDGFQDNALLEPIIQRTDMLQLIKDWGFIGDSLNSGEIYYYKPNGDKIFGDMYEYSWGQNICRQCGTVGTNFSVGGLTSKTWIDRYWNTGIEGYKTGGMGETFNDNPKSVYTICLGTNDKNTNVPIGSWEDVDEDNFENNSDTFYGNYSGIIQRIKQISPSARIFVITIPTIFSANAESYGINDAIRDISDKFTNVFTIELASLCPSSEEITNTYRSWGHLTAAGYVWMSYVIGNIINSVIRNNMEKFNALPFIGTENDDGSL